MNKSSRNILLLGRRFLVRKESRFRFRASFSETFKYSFFIIKENGEEA